MKRVLVIGSSGAGKSTFAEKLGEKTGLPVIHLDQHFWLPGWQQAREEDFDRWLGDALIESEWIMDGNYNRTLETRLAHADTVIFLRLNRWRCLWRVMKRYFKRGYQAEGCPQKVDFQFIHYILIKYPRDNYVRSLKLQEEFPKVKWIFLDSPRAVKRFLNGVA